MEEAWKALEEEKKGGMLQFYLNYNLKSILSLTCQLKKDMLDYGLFQGICWLPEAQQQEERILTS